MSNLRKTTVIKKPFWLQLCYHLVNNKSFIEKYNTTEYISLIVVIVINSTLIRPVEILEKADENTKAAKNKRHLNHLNDLLIVSLSFTVDSVISD